MSQLEKNTVSAKGQLKPTDYVTFLHPEGTGKRVLFVGNSITRHGRLESIGWFGNWGMAASAPEKDYVHLLANRFSLADPDAAFCLCQVAEWERLYRVGDTCLEPYRTARDFEADLLIFRLIENCPAQDFDADLFYRQFEALVDFLNPRASRRIIVTTSFWKHPGDAALSRFAAAHGYPCVPLGDLGEDDAMKAIGLFEHNGVANHPGDKGMQAIADRIFDAAQTLPAD